MPAKRREHARRRHWANHVEAVDHRIEDLCSCRKASLIKHFTKEEKTLATHCAADVGV